MRDNWAMGMAVQGSCQSSSSSGAGTTSSHPCSVGLPIRVGRDPGMGRSRGSRFAYRAFSCVLNLFRSPADIRGMSSMRSIFAIVR